MPDAAYFRRQAETCRRLAESILDEAAEASLASMAEDYDRQADKLDSETPGN